MKKCSKCKKEKELNQFYKKSDRKNGSSECKDCFNAYCVQRWIKRKIQAIEYKGGKCEDCNLSYPNIPHCVFDFHHLNPSEKDFDWKKMRLISLERMKEELNKCVLLCANCHRIRHFNLNL